jgi:hypothetical protein
MFRASSTITEVDVVAFWRAVELFEPQRVPKLDRDRVQDVGDAVLPWEDQRKKRGLSPKQTLQHDVFVGVFSLDEAYAQLHYALGYPDEGENGDPPQAGKSALAVFTVADDGRVIRGSQVLSSCAWAIGQAFVDGAGSRGGRAFVDGAGSRGGRGLVDGAGSRGWLEGCERAASEFRQGFEELVATPDEEDAPDEEGAGDDVPGDEDGAGPVLDRVLLEEIGEYVREQVVPDGSRCAVAIRDAVDVRVRTRVVGTANRYRATERNFLNSFIARDLDTVAQAVGENAAGSALSRYLSSAAEIDDADDRTRTDVGSAVDHVRRALRPDAIPLGRWPSSVAAPADLGQQLALNTILDDGARNEFGGLFAVNGPPGTGKTTLLRDLIAALVVQRAERLAELDRPEDGFRKTPVTFQAGTRKSSVYRLVPELTGFEMVLACATNAAAENVTTEIPLADAIAPEWHERIDYFTDTATNVLDSRREQEDDDREAWGMLAACLGSLSRCKSFATAFWFGDADTSLLHLLKSHKAQPEDWTDAVESFRAALKRATDRREERREYAQLFVDRELALEEGARHAAELLQRRNRVEQARDQQDLQQKTIPSFESAHAASLTARNTHASARPSWWRTLSSRGRARRDWRLRDQVLATHTAEAKQALTDAQKRLAQLASSIAENTELASSHEAREAEERARAENLTQEIARRGELWRERFPDAVYPDDQWAEDSQRAGRELRAPWIDETWNAARTELFLAALSLHKAFVLGAAGKIKHSLGVAIDMIQEKTNAQMPADAVLAAWQCLFIVVPVISTTFASYPRLFRRLGREALGWVLIDEAGQSKPQNAAGPIWRSRSAVVIGDPLQLEPIVTLPLGTQRALAQSHGVAEALLPRYISLQGVADQATPVGTYRGSSDDKVWVGSPLNVHRRCEEPMFGVVNQIAYDGRMIDHTPPREHFPFPASKWLHVTGGQSKGM